MIGPRYAIIPADAVTDATLAGADFRVLALLGKHVDRAGWCTRAQNRMADELGISCKTLQRSLSRLTEAGYVEVEHKKRRDGGQAANNYRLIFDDVQRAERRAASDDDQQTGDADGDNGVAPYGSKMSPPLGHPGDVGGATPGCRPQEERPLQLTTPPDNGMLRCSPANDDAPLLEVGAIEEAGAVPLRRPPQPAAEPVQVPSWTRAETDALGARLRDAAGASINSASPGFLVFAEPIGWLAAGCDLELDILPAVAGVSARYRGPPIRTWSYFTPAVLEARDRRQEMAKPARAGSPDDPRSTARGGEHAQRSRGPSSHRTGSGRRNHADELDAAFDEAFAALLGPVDAG